MIKDISDEEDFNKALEEEIKNKQNIKSFICNEMQSRINTKGTC